MPNKKSSAKSVAKKSARAKLTRMGDSKYRFCPCSDLCEIRIAPDIRLFAVNADPISSPAKITHHDDKSVEIMNPSTGPGVIIWARVAENRHIFPDVDRRAEPPIVTIHEVKEGFPGRGKVKPKPPKPPNM